MILLRLLIAAVVFIHPVHCQSCECDLTAAQCDINCCCDTDCSLADRDAFTVCLNADLSVDNRVCVSDTLLLLNNVELTAKTTGDGLFCIYKDNNEGRNFHSDVQTAESGSRFSELISKYSGRSFFTGSSREPISPAAGSVNKVGSKIPIIFQSNALGYLSVSSASASFLCSDRDPIGFLQDRTSTCNRRIDQLSVQCLADESLNPLSYLEGFKLAPQPFYFAGFSQTDVQPQMSSSVSSQATVLASSSVSPSPSSDILLSSATASSAVLVSPVASSATPSPDKRSFIDFANDSLVVPSLRQPLTCRNSQGVNGQCATLVPVRPTYDAASDICRGIVLEVAYAITYSANSTLDITSIDVAFVLGDVSGSSGLMQQKFSAQFAKDGQSADTMRRSGNPGYVTGAPLLAGKLSVNATTNAAVIVLDNDPTKWFTVVKPPVSGLCREAQQIVPLKFGINIRSGCFIKIKRSMTTAECALLQATINQTLLGNLPTHVGVFGNSLVTNTADWVPVLTTNPLASPSSSSGECTGMVVGVHVQVLHAKAGFLGNPQEKVVGVRINYDAPKTLAYQCFGPYCQPGSSSLEQNVEVVQSVAFIDVSSSPQAELKPKPNFEAKAPNDFFYPFE